MGKLNSILNHRRQSVDTTSNVRNGQHFQTWCEQVTTELLNPRPMYQSNPDGSRSIDPRSPKALTQDEINLIPESFWPALYNHTNRFGREYSTNVVGAASTTRAFLGWQSVLAEEAQRLLGTERAEQLINDEQWLIQKFISVNSAREVIRQLAADQDETGASDKSDNVHHRDDSAPSDRTTVQDTGAPSQAPEEPYWRNQREPDRPTSTAGQEDTETDWPSETDLASQARKQIRQVNRAIDAGACTADQARAQMDASTQMLRSAGCHAEADYQERRFAKLHQALLDQDGDASSPMAASIEQYHQLIDAARDEDQLNEAIDQACDVYEDLKASASQAQIDNEIDPAMTRLYQAASDKMELITPSGSAQYDPNENGMTESDAESQV